jgi:succinoglycan biosynthesis transport protein ExoP
MTDYENQTEERSAAELFTEYANLLLHWWWLLVLIALIAGVTTYLLTMRQTPIYQASALVMVNDAPLSQGNSYSSIAVSQQLTQTYANIMNTRPVLDKVVEKLGLDYINASIQISPIQNTAMMTVTIQDVDPKRAALIANTLVEVFSEQIQIDQTARYADSKKNLQTQMTTINQQIEDINLALAALVDDTANQVTRANLELRLSQAQQSYSYLQQTYENNRLAEVQSTYTNQAKCITAPITPITIPCYTYPKEYYTDTQQYLETQMANLNRQIENINLDLAALVDDTVTQTKRDSLESRLYQSQQSYSYLLQSYEDIRLTEAQSTSTVILKEPAIPQSIPVQPQPLRSTALAVAVGLVLAAGIIFMVEFFNDTIRDPEEITRRWGIPILGVILRYKAKEEVLITFKQPRSPISEAFRSLRTNLQYASVNLPISTLLVTSPSPEDGKTTIVANLAVVLAQSNQNVIVLDADLRKPRLHKMFKLHNRVGLTDLFIRSTDQMDGAVQSTEIPNLHAITSGNIPPNPSELLSSSKMAEILKQLKGQYNIVLVDTPPSLVVTDAIALAPYIDGVLLVINPGITKRGAVKFIVEQLKQVGANVLGIILNDVKTDHARYTYYRGYHYYKYVRGYKYYSDHGQDLTKKVEELPQVRVVGDVFSPTSERDSKKNK